MLLLKTPKFKYQNSNNYKANEAKNSIIKIFLSVRGSYVFLFFNTLNINNICLGRSNKDHYFKVVIHIKIHQDICSNRFLLHLLAKSQESHILCFVICTHNWKKLEALKIKMQLKKILLHRHPHPHRHQTTAKKKSTKNYWSLPKDPKLRIPINMFLL